MRILLAEDEDDIRAYLSQGLREAGYAVDMLANGTDALLAGMTVDYDLLILDIGLPELDGIEICRQLRGQGRSNASILFLTARDAVVDRVAGLDAGGDDYLVKPFAFSELLARVRALLRRRGGENPLLQLADLTMDPATRRVSRAGREIRLTNKEFMLLEYLLRNAGRILTKSMIAEHVWDAELAAETNFIEVYIYALRKKIDAHFEPSLIQTLRGAGYRIAVP